MTRNRRSARQAGTGGRAITAPFRRKLAHLWENEGGPGGATNTLRGLTRSLDLGKEGLVPQRTHNPYSRPCIYCGTVSPPQSMGQPRKYCSDECRAGHYRDRRRRPVAKRPVGERLQSKLSRNDATGCMEFTGYRNEHGYGVIWDGGGRTALAHRVAWAATHGAIPDEMQVRHTCDNPPCCNTDHLELGTHLDNMRDRDDRGRTLRGEAAARHSDATIRRVRQMLADGTPYRQITASTGVSHGHIAYIKKRPGWRAG